MSHFTALYDACVLYGASLRDLLMELALTGLFRAKWTEQINDEWIRNLIANRTDLPPENIERIRGLMNRAVLDCLVADYESLICSVTLPDPCDRHVLAAAIKGQADVIVTFNLDHFPSDALEIYGIEAQHPDVFIAHLIDLEPGFVCNAVKKMRQRMKNPPRRSEEVLDWFGAHGLVQTVEALSSFIDLI